jgi:transporter family protein
MWILPVIFSAIFLGVYDVCKKESVKENAVLVVMLISSGTSLILMLPMLIDSAFWTGILANTPFAVGGTCLN